MGCGGAFARVARRQLGSPSPRRLGRLKPTPLFFQRRDAATGTQLAALKGNTGVPNGLALAPAPPAPPGLAPPPALVIAAQAGRGALHAWTLGRDAVTGRSFPPEPAKCVASTPDGGLVAAGGPSGAAWLWEGSTGRLLAAWAPHYRATSAIAISRDGTWLLTGGDDGGVAAWECAAVADAARTAGAPPPTARHAWAAHTLPVTAVVIGNAGASPLALSASLDGRVRCACAASGATLRDVTLPSPPRAAALDAADAVAYAGCEDGVLYELDLIGVAGQQAAAAGLPPGVAAALRGHTRAITAVAAPPGPVIISGSLDGDVRVWDVRSRAPLRTLKPAGVAPGGVVAIVAAPAGCAPRGVRPGDRPPPPTRPPALGRDRQDPWWTPPVVLTGAAAFAGRVAACWPGLGDESTAVAAAAPSTTAPAADLTAQLADARAEAAKWKALHAKLVAAAAATLGD